MVKPTVAATAAITPATTATLFVDPRENFWMDDISIEERD
jgi:hypothetical protein